MRDVILMHMKSVVSIPAGYEFEHYHMVLWLAQHLQATYDKYVQHAKSLGIIYFNEETFNKVVA